MAATRSFEEAARLNPGDPQTCLTLGVALAKQNRFREAIVQFEAVLRLDPTNGAAKRYLQNARIRDQSNP
jgi:cytochrome c-type biogenesis protein CcmH/NrfG